MGSNLAVKKASVADQSPARQGSDTSGLALADADRRMTRRRRSPAEAREEILNAAEQILLTSGPVDIKIQQVARLSGISLSTVHHHFGGIAEIHQALAARMLNSLNADLSDALTVEGSDPMARVEAALQVVYDVIASPQYVKLTAWLRLSSQMSQWHDLVQHPIFAIRELVIEKLLSHIPRDKAEEAASALIYGVAATASGEGMVAYAMGELFGEEAAKQGSHYLRKALIKDILTFLTSPE